MKIKLNRDLWNHKSGETFDVPEPNAVWAVKKGYAEVMSESQPENKAIEPKYKKNRNATQTWNGRS